MLRNKQFLFSALIITTLFTATAIGMNSLAGAFLYGAATLGLIWQLWELRGKQ